MKYSKQNLLYILKNLHLCLKKKKKKKIDINIKKFTNLPQKKKKKKKKNAQNRVRVLKSLLYSIQTIRGTVLITVSQFSSRFLRSKLSDLSIKVILQSRKNPLCSSA